MWLFIPGAFLSIVAPSRYDGVNVDSFLKVRARFKGDIERVFPGFKVKVTPASDYRFRAFIPRERVAYANRLAVAEHGLSKLQG